MSADPAAILASLLQLQESLATIDFKTLTRQSQQSNGVESFPKQKTTLAEKQLFLLQHLSFIGRSEDLHPSRMSKLAGRGTPPLKWRKQAITPKTLPGRSMSVIEIFRQSSIRQSNINPP